MANNVEIAKKSIQTFQEEHLKYTGRPKDGILAEIEDVLIDFTLVMTSNSPLQETEIIKLFQALQSTLDFVEKSDSEFPLTPDEKKDLSSSKELVKKVSEAYEVNLAEPQQKATKRQQRGSLREKVPKKLQRYELKSSDMLMK